MKALAVVVVLFLVAIVGVGIYRSWFRVSTDNAASQPSATITVDKDKIRADEQKAKDALQGFEKEAKNKLDESAGKVKEAVHRP